jgi:GT2 family glycosyltransferase
VAIATYDGRRLLETVLPSVERQSFRNFRVVVVDDCSQDDTQEWMRDQWPHVELIIHPENRGVACAFNTCVQALEGDYLLLLNNDVELDERCLEELVAAMNADTRVAVAGAKLLDFHRRELLDGTGDAFSWAGFAYRRGQGELDHGQYDSLHEVFSACGAAALYRRSALEAVGPFDEQFFALNEDVDWSFRALLAGYRARYVPTAIAYHIGSASLGPRVSPFTLYHNWRNQIWIVTKNYPVSALARHAPDLLVGQLAMLFVAIRRRSLRMWLGAWRDALLGLPQMLVKRRKIQGTRACGRRELEPVIEGALARARWWLLGSGRGLSVAARQSAPR